MTADICGKFVAICCSRLGVTVRLGVTERFGVTVRLGVYDLRTGVSFSVTAFFVLLL